MKDLGLLLLIAQKGRLQVCADDATDFLFYQLNHASDVVNAVSSAIPLALIPQENSTFGAVIETSDVLRLPIAGQGIFVAGETTLNIQHCLLVRRGVKFEHIETILSHEQASRLSLILVATFAKHIPGFGPMSELYIHQNPRCFHRENALDKRSRTGAAITTNPKSRSFQMRSHLLSYRCHRI
jgi:hypothetical protein